MSADLTIAGIQAGLTRPLALVALPVVATLLAWLLLWQREQANLGRRTRALVFGSRLLVVTLLIVSAAGPYTVNTQVTEGDPTVTMLVDRSDSTAVTNDVAGELAADIEEAGVEVQTRTVAEGARSPVGDGISNSLRANGTVLLVSDGRVTEGRSLSAAASLARQVNATISSVNLTAAETERAVSVSGPAKTSTGVANSFYVSVDGVQLNNPVQVSVAIDGETITTRELTSGGFEVRQNFTKTGSHRVTATIESDDRYDRNDVARKTVRVVDPPRILYVARGKYPFEDFLRQIYQVDRAESVPSDLSGYYAVVVQDVAAADLGDVPALQRAVVNGTGLVTIGGENAFEAGEYERSLYADMLPVTVGQGGRTGKVVLAVDISGSTRSSLSVQQALALDVIDQMGNGNQVGIVAFNTRAYRIADLAPLGPNRNLFTDRIRRLESGGGTDISSGLSGAGDLLGPGGGTVIVLTDGVDRSDASETAATLAGNGVQIIPVGVGESVDADALRQVAAAGGGTYLSADETDRLRLLFGGTSRQYRGDGLTIVDDRHFITSGVRFDAEPSLSNTVTVRDRADYLVAGPAGNPAFAAWRYGLGRSVSVTAYGGDGTLDGLLEPPDSLALTKSVNWAIGDPERLETGITSVPDARVGALTTLTYEGNRRPSTAEYQFSQVAPEEYQTTFVPEDAGYHSVLDAEYAVNYPAEYAGFGLAPDLQQAVRSTDGQVYQPDQAEAIAQQVRDRSRSAQTVRTDWTWLTLSLALLGYLTEAGARRLQEVRT